MMIEDAHEALKDRINISFDRFCELFSTYEIKPVRGGAVFVKGNEVHVAVKKEARGKWLSRALIRGILGEIIEKHGKAITSVMQENEAGNLFVKRLGFKPVGEKNGSIRYELDELCY